MSTTYLQDDVRVQIDSTALAFAWALCQRDCHDLLNGDKVYAIAWAVAACEDYGHESKGQGEELEPYGRMVEAVLEYDRKNGHTPNLDQLCDYLLLTGVGAKSTHNFECVAVLQAYDKDLSENNGAGKPADAEVEFEHWFEMQQHNRLVATMFRAVDMSLGSKKTYDPQTRTERKSTYGDAQRLIANFTRFDFMPSGSHKQVVVPDIPEEAMYGWLGRKAKELGTPLGFAYPAMLGVFTGKGVRVTDDAVHPYLFVGLIGDKHSGKSETLKRVERSLDAKPMDSFGGYVCRRSASSDRGLFTLFGDDPKKKDVPSKRGKSFVMLLTELRHMFTKMGMQNSGLPSMLCALWDDGKDAGTADKYGSHGCEVNVSIVGGLKAKDPSEFGDVFGHESMHGLDDRFIFGISGEKFEYMPWNGRPEVRIPVEVEVPDWAWARLRDWKRAGARDRERLGHNAIRVAVITEAAKHGRDPEPDVLSPEHQHKLVNAIEGVGEVTHETYRPMKVTLSVAALDAALKFMEWQEGVRAVYQPSQALTLEARCSDEILKVLAETGGFQWNTMQKNRHWSQKYGSSMVARIRHGMVLNGEISYDKDTGWVSPA